MNVIFLTISRIREIKSRGIYADLMRKFRDEGHNVYIVTPFERQFALPTSLSEGDGIHVLGVQTFNIQKTNVVEKGIGTILLEYQYKKAIKKSNNKKGYEISATNQLHATKHPKSEKKSQKTVLWLICVLYRQVFRTIFYFLKLAVHDQRSLSATAFGSLSDHFKMHADSIFKVLLIL